MPAFEWDDRKYKTNLARHGVAFEDAALIWSDPLHLLRFDRIEDGEERWHALGMAGGVVLLLAVHAYSDGDSGDAVRIISARRATKAERRAYADETF